MTRENLNTQRLRRAIDRAGFGESSLLRVEHTTKKYLDDDYEVAEKLFMPKTVGVSHSEHRRLAEMFFSVTEKYVTAVHSLKNSPYPKLIWKAVETQREDSDAASWRAGRDIYRDVCEEAARIHDLATEIESIAQNDMDEMTKAEKQDLILLSARPYGIECFANEGEFGVKTISIQHGFKSDAYSTLRAIHATCNSELVTQEKLDERRAVLEELPQPVRAGGDAR